MNWNLGLKILFGLDLFIFSGLALAELLGADVRSDAMHDLSMRLLIEVSAFAVLKEVRRG